MDEDANAALRWSRRSGSDRSRPLQATTSAPRWPRRGLALDGTDGVVHVLRCLLAEADLLMAIDGYPTLADLRRAVLMKV